MAFQFEMAAEQKGERGLQRFQPVFGASKDSSLHKDERMINTVIIFPCKVYLSNLKKQLMLFKMIGKQKHKLKGERQMMETDK